MNISTIEQGEELLKRATPGRWYARYAYKKEEVLRQMNLIGATAVGHAIVTDHEGGTHPSQNLELLVWLRNHASELLQMAREVEGMKENAQSVLMSLPITPIVLKHNGNVADVVFEPGSITPSEDSK
jgi:hypothetical protein